MVLSLADFIEYLRQRDFNVGVEHLLRAQIIIDTLDQDFHSQKSFGTARLGGPDKTGFVPRDDFPPEKLKTRLASIFAVNKEEQLRFYKAFDDYVLYVSRPATVTVPPKGPQPPRRKWKGAIVALSISAVAILSVVLWIGITRKTERPGETVARAKSISFAAPRPSGSPDPNQSASQRPSPTPSISQTPLQTQRATPITPVQEFQPPTLKSYLGVLAAGLLVFGIYEWVNHLKRRRLLQTQQSKSPPFSWPLSVKAPKFNLYRSDQFFQAVRRLRRRRIAEHHRLNIPATIAATIKSIGYPSFRYKPDTNIPEYLMLIDRASLRDHQAHLFDELFKALKREGLYIARYFYERDPILCFDEAGRNFHNLSELVSKHHDHRLLIFGDGQKLIDPISGRLAEWVGIFFAWHDRALLTPVSTAEWGLREAQLATQFSVLPSTVTGLRELASYFAPPITRELEMWDSSDADMLPRDLTADDVVTELRPRLGEDLFQWLCACAVYPELQWEFTLQIGSLACMPPGLVNEPNLLRLSRLPWFVAGAIPEDVRVSLSKELDPEKEYAVRNVIIELLGNDAPPDETFAADSHALELALQQWLAIRDADNLRRLQEALRNIPSNEILNDQVLVHHLEKIPPSPLARLLPRPVRRRVYKHGLPHFGFSSAVRFLAMLFLVVLVSIGMRAGAIPVLFPNEGPTGTPVPSPRPTPSPGIPTPPPSQNGMVTPDATPGSTPATTPGSGTPTETPTASPTPTPTATPTATPSTGPISRLVIVGLQPSRRGVELPCSPGFESEQCRSNGTQITINAVTLGAEGKSVRYSWTPTVGKINGSGSTVVWDLSGAKRGTENVTVTAEADGSLPTTMTLAVPVLECPRCKRIVCPAVSVDCPTEAKEGSTVVFRARVESAPTSPRESAQYFQWTISAGKIESGQGTSSIVVDTSGLGGQKISATVKVGFRSACDGTASCTSVVIAK